MATQKIPGNDYQGTFMKAADGSPVLVMVSRTEDIFGGKKVTPKAQPKTKRKGTVEKVNGKTILTTADGKVIRLMNPAEKGKKAAFELKTGVKYTNLGQVKTDKNGTPIKLKPKEKSWRSGYLDARSDNAKAYKAKNGKSAGKGKAAKF